MAYNACLCGLVITLNLSDLCGGRHRLKHNLVKLAGAFTPV